MIGTHLPDQKGPSSGSYFTSSSSKSRHKPIVEVEGLRLGEKFIVDADADVGEDLLEKIKDELLDRITKVEVNSEHAKCTFDPERYQSHLTPQQSKLRFGSIPPSPISIALNLFNSEEVLPSLSIALLTTVAFLKSLNHKVYLSIYENDSKDRTLLLLGELGSAMLALDIDGLFIRHSNLHRHEDTERIIALAQMRNEVLYPLIPYLGNPGDGGVLLFVNDVITCASDLLELLAQLKFQNADAVFSTDWFPELGDAKPIRFRDIWVMRGINGDLPYAMQNRGGIRVKIPGNSYVKGLFWSQEEKIWQRWLEGLPVPVYSGWNGAVAFDADIFTQLHLRFRGSGVAKWNGGDSAGTLGSWGELIASDDYLASDCPASECKLLARDLWNLKLGRVRFLVAPQSRTAYSLQDWQLVEAQYPLMPRPGTMLDTELIDWNNVTMPEKVTCVPSIVDGKPLSNPWEEENHRRSLGKSCARLLYSS